MLSAAQTKGDKQMTEAELRQDILDWFDSQEKALKNSMELCKDSNETTT